MSFIALIWLKQNVKADIVNRQNSYSYITESTIKDYEAACLQADFIRYIIDHFDGETSCANIGAEIEESYYEFFDGLDLGQFNTNGIKSIKDFESYGWCY